MQERHNLLTTLDTFTRRYVQKRASTMNSRARWGVACREPPHDRFTRQCKTLESCDACYKMAHTITDTVHSLLSYTSLLSRKILVQSIIVHHEESITKTSPDKDGNICRHYTLCERLVVKDSVPHWNSHKSALCLSTNAGLL